MRKPITKFVPAVAAVVAVPLLGAIGTPANAADGTGCTTAWPYVATNASLSTTVNASIDCNGVWVLQSLSKKLRVKGQYYKNGAWHASTLSPKWVSPTSTQQQIIGNTVDGRKVRGHKLKGKNDFVEFKF